MKHIPNVPRWRKADKYGSKRTIPSFEYFIDENKEGEISGCHYKGIVVAKMKDNNLPLAFAWNPSWNYSFLEVEDIFKGVCGYSPVFNEPSFIGIAYCMDGDTFDLEEGKKIARLKCWNKYYNWVYKILDEFEEKLAYFCDLIYEAKNLADDKSTDTVDQIWASQRTE